MQIFPPFWTRSSYSPSIGLISFAAFLLFLCRRTKINTALNFMCKSALTPKAYKLVYSPNVLAPLIRGRWSLKCSDWKGKVCIIIIINRKGTVEFRCSFANKPQAKSCANNRFGNKLISTVSPSHSQPSTRPLTACLPPSLADPADDMLMMMVSKVAAATTFHPTIS